MKEKTFIHCQKDGFTISTDPSRLDMDLIHSFLSGESYWAKGSSKEGTMSALDDLIVYGIYRDGRQVGFASVVSDFTTFAYISDIFIVEEFRGQGLSKWLLEVIAEHPDMGNEVDWMLLTDDAQGLYEQFNFKSVSGRPEQMEKRYRNDRDPSD